MCICSSSFFLSLPVFDARVVRPSSENRKWRLRGIQYSITNCSGRSHVSVHKIITFSSSKTGHRSYFGAIDSDNFAFLGKFRCKEKSRENFVSLRSALSNEEDVVHDKVESSPSEFLVNDSAEIPREIDLIGPVGETDLRNNGSRGIKQMTTRSNLVAKQVIKPLADFKSGSFTIFGIEEDKQGEAMMPSIETWLVLVVDIKPSLLSGESERFMLKDIAKVGDVVLVDDEAVLDTEFKIVGLETLVGYRVVTPRGRNIGKVRGYSFNINSGIVESLELDSFGVTIIPSNLVSTYRLDVEDIIEVFEDIVVVHEAAASRKQRLTKGLWDAQFGSEYSDVEEFERSSGRRRQRRSKRSSRKKKDLDDEEWDIFR